MQVGTIQGTVIERDFKGIGKVPVVIRLLEDRITSYEIKVRGKR